MAEEVAGAMTLRFIVKFSQEGHSGPGYYVWLEEYPEEGSAHFDSMPTAADLQHVFGTDEGESPEDKP